MQINMKYMKSPDCLRKTKPFRRGWKMRIFCCYPAGGGSRLEQPQDQCQTPEWRWRSRAWLCAVSGGWWGRFDPHRFLVANEALGSSGDTQWILFAVLRGTKVWLSNHCSITSGNVLSCEKSAWATSPWATLWPQQLTQGLCLHLLSELLYFLTNMKNISSQK